MWLHRGSVSTICGRVANIDAEYIAHPDVENAECDADEYSEVDAVASSEWDRAGVRDVYADGDGYSCTTSRTTLCVLGSRELIQSESRC